MSVLEYEWFIILEASIAHDIGANMHRFMHFLSQYRKNSPINRLQKRCIKIHLAQSNQTQIRHTVFYKLIVEIAIGILKQ
jgi:hypothetical protein